MTSFNLKSLQEKLNQSKKMISNLDDRFKEHEQNQKYKKLNDEYKAYCSKFSPAYLSGSPWYVGENLVDDKQYSVYMNIAYLHQCIFYK